MKNLNKEQWTKQFFMTILTLGISNLFLAKKIGAYDEEAWYTKPLYWVLAFLCFIFPLPIMFMVFYFTITTHVCEKLNVPYKEIYLSPYVWLLCLGVPIIGWSLFCVMSIYVIFWPVVMIHRGEGEKYINKEVKDE